jgi:putative acetyltransferase
VRIRPAEPGDEAGIRAVHLAAFPTSAEAELVERLAQEGDAVVSLVADAAGTIAGHVMMSRMHADGDGRPLRALGLAPIAVLPGYQGGGIGAALIHGGLAIARATGEDLVFVLGEPDYYTRFGFSAEAAAPFASPYAGPYFMALALKSGAAPQSGNAAYARAFSELP